jgi:hypothetical protein
MRTLAQFILAPLSALIGYTFNRVAFSFLGAKMIDPQSETLTPMSKVPAASPGRPNLSTIWRWRNRGVRGHRLETILVGGRRYTSREAITRFLAAINGEPIRSETLRQREQAIDRAEKRAEELGI